MLTQFIMAHAGFIFFIGVMLSLGGGIWFVFASYSRDVELARWTWLMPPLALLMVIRYPETCLRPFLLNLLGVLILGVCWMALFANHAGYTLSSSGI